MRHIVTNQIRTPDGNLLTSINRHDYKTYTDANGEEYMVDGGCDYLRRNSNVIPAEELAVYSDDAHVRIRKGFYWGTYGKLGDSPFTYVSLRDLETAHIEAILNTQEQLPAWRRDIFIDELEYREENNIE
jgi:hypothetical protein